MIKQLTTLLLFFATPVFSQDKLDELVNAYVKQGEFNGSVLVAQHGQILLEKNYGVDDAHAVYQIASVTKTFTSTLILKLNELHLLSLTDKLSKYYPDYPKGDSITIQQLLTHTSGVYNYTMNSDFMNTSASKPIDEEKMLALFKDHALDFSPGTGWNYSNSGYMLLGYISQKVTHLSYQQAIRKYIFSPLKMDHSGFDFAHLAVRATGYYSDSAKVYNKLAPLVDSSVSFAAGSIYSTVDDLYKWHMGLEHYRIIGKASTEKALTMVKNNYGYGWQIDSLYGHKIVSHGGGIWGFRSNFTRQTDDDICIVLLSNVETPVLESITKKLLAILYHQPYEIPFKKISIKLNEDLLKKYTGTYKISTPKELVIDMVLQNGELVALPHNGPRSVLSAEDETHFFISDDEDFKITFIVENGQVKSCEIVNNGMKRIAEKLSL